jgi:cytochrome c
VTDRRTMSRIARSPALVLALCLGAVFARAAAGDASPCAAALGEQVFAKCTLCHSLRAGEHLTGPSLAGLSGRRAGTITGFTFSNALREANIVWTSTTLDAFLTDPQALVPGTAMPFGGIRNSPQRVALVCYLLGDRFQ